MLYFDNAATSLHKPPQVAAAVMEAMGALGNPGRGAYEPALQAARRIHAARQLVAELFNAPGAERIAFAYNSTQALNTAIFGLLGPGDHAITTVCEHNSVLRPLYALEQQGLQVTRLDCDGYGRIDYSQLERSLQKNTKAVVLAHASNVTGNVVDLSIISDFARAHNLLLIVDAAQTAGCLPIDMQRTPVDVLCFTGHKGLLGPTGTGGLYVRPGLQIPALVVGGSGVQSFLPCHPQQMPTALEAGTPNVQGIAGLHAALLARKDNAALEPAAVHSHELQLARRFIEGVKDIPGIRLYGDYRPGSLRVGIVSLNLGDEDAGAVSDALWEQYGICTRAGAHCAPLLHKALGTERQGAVRFSFGPYNTLAEVDAAVNALRELAEV